MEMETSTELMDPLTPSVAALAVQPEGGSGRRTAPGGCLVWAADCPPSGCFVRGRRTASQRVSGLGGGLPPSGCLVRDLQTAFLAGVRSGM